MPTNSILSPGTSSTYTPPPLCGLTPITPTRPPPLSPQMQTRSKHGIVKPNPKFGLSAIIRSPLPKNHKQALSDPNWNAAMRDEYSALIETGTWDLVPRSAGVNIVNCMWLFRHKLNDNGDLERHKARLVCDGKSQVEGADCDETFSPVVKPATIRTILSLAMALQ
ncbi:uncharacterized protein LOC110726973 [Chenopodium quinoa]|uniref:uncharacterized protein LOC110726973 n=1 Tax=Chenopodium quinoa TaxID=63459 RepID=UPI000B79A393|nr:uncharacterized protein LOC110726973 [Chenopodium quinoa]